MLPKMSGLLIVLFAIVLCVSSFEITLFDETYFRGPKTTISISSGQCHNLRSVQFSSGDNAADSVSSVDTSGNCIRVYRYYDCTKSGIPSTGVDGRIAPGTPCHHDFSCLGFNDDIQSISDCNYVTKCSSDEFTCSGSRKCIPEGYRCDGDDDCEDNSDEAGCLTEKLRAVTAELPAVEITLFDETNFRGPKTTISIYSGECHNLRSVRFSSGDIVADSVSSVDTRGNCIRVYRYYDCTKSGIPSTGVDGRIAPGTPCHHDFSCLGFNDDIRSISDCNYVTKCSSDEFTCSISRKCIPEGYRCNGDDDCEDNSDEAGCLTEKLRAVTTELSAVARTAGYPDSLRPAPIRTDDVLSGAFALLAAEARWASYALYWLSGSTGAAKIAGQVGLELESLAVAAETCITSQIGLGALSLQSSEVAVSATALIAAAPGVGVLAAVAVATMALVTTLMALIAQLQTNTQTTTSKPQCRFPDFSRFPAHRNSQRIFSDSERKATKDGSLVEIYYEEKFSNYRQAKIPVQTLILTILKSPLGNHPRMDFYQVWVPDRMAEMDAINPGIYGDRRGHLLFDKVGGTNEKWNLAPQAIGVNHGDGSGQGWRSLEIEIQNWLTNAKEDTCRSVMWQLTIEYDEVRYGARPSVFTVQAFFMEGEDGIKMKTVNCYNQYIGNNAPYCSTYDGMSYI